MASFRSCKQTAIVLLLGLLGLCTSTGVAQAQPRLLFLGISQNGREFQPAESAIKLRLTGLEVTVAQPSPILDPPCERADCLAAALSSEHADLALTGRILKNEHACLATLWLATGKTVESTMAHDILCRPDAKDSELAENLLDGASTMVDSYLRNHATPGSATLAALAIEPARVPISAELKNKWSWKKKFAVAGLGTLLGLGIVGVASFAARDKQPVAGLEQCPDDRGTTCTKYYNFSTQIALSATLTAGAAAAFIATAIR